MTWTGRSFCLDSVFILGLLEWWNRSRKISREHSDFAESYRDSKTNFLRKSGQTPTWPCPSCLSSQPDRGPGSRSRSAMSPPSILKACTYLHVWKKKKRPRIARTSDLNLYSFLRLTDSQPRMGWCSLWKCEEADLRIPTIDNNIIQIFARKGKALIHPKDCKPHSFPQGLKYHDEMIGRRP